MPEMTEPQQIAITEILGITRDSLTSQLVYLGARLTQGVIDRIAAHITSWNAGIGSNWIDIEPNTANFGAKIKRSAAREQIQNAIANLLEMENYSPGGSGHYEVELTRG